MPSTLPALPTLYQMPCQSMPLAGIVFKKVVQAVQSVSQKAPRKRTRGMWCGIKGRRQESATAVAAR